MVRIELIDLPNLTWHAGKSARLWYLQPHLALTDVSPRIPVRANGEATAFELLQATLPHEAQCPPPEEAPTLILLPEYSIHPQEIEPACALLKEAHPNTIAVFGVGQMTVMEAIQHDSSPDLWQGAPRGALTNCAVIALGGSGRRYLQPKIIASRWEEDLWLGHTVRYFVGNFLQLIVVICSDLLGRPEDSTVIASIVNHLRKRGRTLNLVIWVQHNQRPRSPEFLDSIASLSKLRPEPTVLAVASRKDRSRRLDNFAVSGALLPYAALPSRFNLTCKAFHYCEPVSHPTIRMSRVVLLRYDADCNLVRTVLADCISQDDHAARGALFESSTPFIYRQDALIECQLNTHIEDVCRKATSQAVAARPDLSNEIQATSGRLARLRTREFLAFLDLAILPRPKLHDKPHIAGKKHEGGDFLCTCWAHRECIDKVADDDDSALPLFHVLLAQGALERVGILATPSYDDANHLTDLSVNVAGAPRRLAIVYPFDLDAAGTEKSLVGLERPPILDRGYVILGTPDRPRRPAIPLANAARPSPSGAVEAGTAATPQPRAIYNDEFWDCFTNGSLHDRIINLFS